MSGSIKPESERKVGLEGTESVKRYMVRPWDSTGQDAGQVSSESLCILHSILHDVLTLCVT